jgi:hypothetical protein
MTTYNTFLGVDGMPLLWPRAPLWPTDPSIQARLLQITGLPAKIVDFVLQNNRKQRLMDTRWRHFIHLVSSFPKEEKRSCNAWKELLCDPSGWVAPDDWIHRQQLATATEYSNAYGKACMQLSPHFSYPANFTPPGGKCDECKTPCTSECGVCGELFCSRSCLRKAWSKGHRDICETVQENCSFAVTMTQIEFNMFGRLNWVEMNIAYGSYGFSSLEAKRMHKQRKNAKQSEKKMVEEARRMDIVRETVARETVTTYEECIHFCLVALILGVLVFLRGYVFSCVYLVTKFRALINSFA